MTPQEAAVIEAAMEWSMLRQGAQFVPIYKALGNALNHLDEACSDLFSECEGQPWMNPHG